jgi:uncharacterized membrane protein YoaK (UPF0700 family)
MRERFRRNRHVVERAILAFILPAVAGAINASGFFAVGTYTSHVTGLVARVGNEIVIGHAWLAFRAAFFLGSFLFGAMVCTFLVLYGKRIGGPPYWRPLLLEVALLFVFATVNVGSEHRAHVNSFLMTSIICMAMGLQNALVTKLSGARIRTTHMTGITTDIGIETARTIDTWREGTRGMGLTAALWHLKWFWQDHELRKLRLHVAILLSFLVGATLGPLGYLAFGHLAMLVPCLVLAGLAAFDAWIGLSAHTLGHPGDAPLHTSA